MPCRSVNAAGTGTEIEQGKWILDFPIEVETDSSHDQVTRIGQPPVILEVDHEQLTSS